MAYDLKITGGEIVDGTGAARYRGDVGIKDGKVVALGRVPDKAERRNMPDAVLEQRVELAPVRSRGVEQRQRKDGGKLHRLFLDRHLAQQRIRALHGGERRGRLLAKPGACQQKQHRRDNYGAWPIISTSFALFEHAQGHGLSTSRP